MDLDRDLARASASGPFGPALGDERIRAMDTLRGVAVLRILLMNILGFA